MKVSHTNSATATAALLAFVFLAAGLSGCSSQPNGTKAMLFAKAPVLNSLSAVAPPVPVEDEQTRETKGPVSVDVDDAQKHEIGLATAVAKRGLVYKTVESPGRVGPDAEQSRAVSTPSAGRVADVKARLGDFVKCGQVMAVIKSDPIGQVQSDLLQNTLQSRADIKQQEVQLKLSHITYDRELTLFKEQISAKADLQMAENQLEKDEANLAALKAKMEATIRVAQERLTLLGAPPDSARKVLAQDKIDPWVIVRAPASGLVIERNVNPGEMNDGSKPLFTITDLSEVWLFGDIFEKDIEDVRKGEEAVVTVDSLPEHKFPASIIWVGDSINPTTRTLPVRANVVNPDLLLKPGMFARMKVSAGSVSVLQIPRSAIIQKGDKTLVFVDAGGGKYTEREVQTGKGDQENIEILAGLTAGERVVSHGSIALLGAAMKSAEGR
jgi:cobalt-zinc-cadmium efflux system membrane fusion protein